MSRRGFRRNHGTLVVPNEESLDKFREFHRKDPRSTGIFALDLDVPKRARLLGDAVHVLYRSDKIDPETGKQPRGTIDYIHEHDGGCETFLPATSGGVEVPAWIRAVPGLVLLGDCLGIAWSEDGETVEQEPRRPLPELYCTPCGRALFVIDRKSRIEAMVWGGSLRVEDRGICG